MAKMFGPNCKFVSLSVSSFAGALELIEALIRAIRSQKEEHRRNLLDLVKNVREQKAGEMVNRAASKSCSLM